MFIRKSHNDYWTNPQIFRAIANDCQIIEIDVIYHRRKAYLSHSWRPFKCMTYGNIRKYFSYFAKHKGPGKLYLMIELKTVNEKVVQIIADLIKQNDSNYVEFLIYFDHKNKKRKAVAKKLYDEVSQYGKSNIYNKWVDEKFLSGHLIETMDLFKNQPLWKRLNHF